MDEIVVSRPRAIWRHVRRRRGAAVLPVLSGVRRTGDPVVGDTRVVVGRKCGGEVSAGRSILDDAGGVRSCADDDHRITTILKTLAEIIS